VNGLVSPTWSLKPEVSGATVKITSPGRVTPGFTFSRNMSLLAGMLPSVSGSASLLFPLLSMRATDAESSVTALLELFVKLKSTITKLPLFVSPNWPKPLSYLAYLAGMGYSPGHLAKFSLAGNHGLSILAAGFPTSQKVTCNAGAPQDMIEETVTAGNSYLSYDSSLNQYNYVWKTDKAWAGTCRVFSMKLIDGTTHTALFPFTR
jgi:hypothetical protein